MITHNRTWLILLAKITLLTAWSSTAAVAAERIVLGWHAEEEIAWPAPQPSSLSALVSRPLLALADDTKLRCELCAELPTAVDQSFTLELTGTWGDGERLDAEDIRLGWLWATRHATSTATKNLLGRIRSIHREGRFGVKFTFDGPAEMAAQALTHVWPLRSLRVEVGPLPARRQGIAADLDYQIASMERNRTDAKWYLGPYRLTAVPTPKRWLLTDAAGREIEVRFYRNADSLRQRFADGAIDVIPDDGFDIQQTVDMKRDELNADTFVSGRTHRFEHLDFNLRNPLLVDRRVRVALGLAIDRQSFDVYGTIQDTPHLLSTHAWHPHDADKARDILENAGWKLGEDGIRTRDGELLTLTLSYPDGHAERAHISQSIAEMWTAIGVKVEVEAIPADRFLSSHVRKVLFRGAALYSWELTPKAIPMSGFHSRAIPLAQNDYVGQNVSSWQNRQVDELLDTWAKTGEDQSEAWQQLYMEDVPQVPLFVWHRTSLVNSRMRGVQYTSTNEPLTHSVTQWSKSTTEKGVALP